MLRFILATLVAFACCESYAHAQPIGSGNDAATSAEAEEARGRAYFRAGAFADAAAAFERSYALAPKTSMLFNIARAYEEAGNRERAADYYKKFLGQNPTRQDLRIEADARSRALAKELADKRDADEKAAAKKKRLDNARKLVRSGAQKVAAGALNEAIALYRQAFDLDPDPATVFEIAEAYRLKGDATRAIGEYGRYRKLAPTGPRAGEAFAHIERLEAKLARKRALANPRDPGMPGRKIAGMVVGGVGAAGVVTGVVLALVAKGKWSDVREECIATYPMCAPETVSLGEAAGTFANAATITIGVGLAATAAGALLYFTAPDPEAQRSEHAVAITPAVTNDAVGVTVGGRF